MRSEEDLFCKKPLPILIFMTMFFMCQMANGSVDMETVFHKATIWRAKMLAAKSRGKSKFITVIILKIFLQDEESILVH